MIREQGGGMPVSKDQIIKLLSIGEEHSKGAQDPRVAGLVDLACEMGPVPPARDAPVREVMARLGDNWSALILKILASGRFRHTTLKRLMGAYSSERGISQRMLTLRLKELERNGFVSRTVRSEFNPPRVEYGLTPMGQALLVEFSKLHAWIEESKGAVEDARRAFNEDERPR